MKNINEFIHNIKLILGKRLVSVLIYGAKASESTENLRTNADLIIIVENLEGVDLKNLSNIVKKWTKEKNPPPVFLDKDEWYSSSDVYAMEYEDIKSSGRVLYGQDLISDIEVNRDDLRFQCELETKNLLVKFRQYYLENSNTPANLKRPLVFALKSCLAIFKTILKLNNEIVPQDKKTLIEKVSDLGVADGKFFLKLLCLKENRCKINNKEAEELSLRFISALTKVLQYVDKI